MNTLRHAFEKFYGLIQPAVFKITANNPEHAHELFAFFCKALYAIHLDKMVLDNDTNYQKPPFELSNAAGFNKNGEIPPQVMKYLGFDRVVIGTVTYDAWKGNPKPRIKRYPETESMVNWMGLPGIGAKAVADNLASYGCYEIPITINLMSTPKKQGDELLKDLESTILATRDLPNVDRYELNISCPNTHCSCGAIDARAENLRMLDAMLKVLDNYVHPQQQIYLKVSPNSTAEDVIDTLDTAKSHRLQGIVTANSSTQHDRTYIPISPQVDGQQVGGATGNAVYNDSLRTQMLYNFHRISTELNFEIIACGGINSLPKLEERLINGAGAIQVFTPIIFSGPQLLQEFRNYKRREYIRK